MEKVEKLVIIGSGPAGLTAAIYTARGNLNPIVITGRAPLGQLMLTTDMDDFPGFPEGIQGPELMQLIKSQAARFGTRFTEEDVVSVKLDKHPFEVITETGTILTQSIIIATGASAKWLGLPSERELIGRGVSACATCDGPFFKGKKVAVVGGGDTAMREAQHLSKYAISVLVIHRRGTFKAQKALVELVKGKPNVEFILSSVIEEILGKEKVEGIKVRNIETGEVSKIELDGVFVAVGHKPNTDFLERQIKLNENGYIIVKNETHTSIPGVFVAGDVADYRYRQAVTAAGAGAKAALDVEEYLESL